MEAVVRKRSIVAPEWWDYTTLDDEILRDASLLEIDDLVRLSRPGFEVRIYDTLEEFYLAEALEYVHSWQRATADSPCGLCGPIGPTEQLPLVARIVNDLGIDVRDGHFWAMDEWVVDGKAVEPTHPLSFARADLDLCFNRIDRRYRMPDSHLHFLTVETIDRYRSLYDEVSCLVMQGGQGEVKHWAFNDPPKRSAPNEAAPPSPEEYRSLPTRVVDLHPMTLIQNARTSGGGVVSAIPTQAITVGPVETWKAETVSIWHAGMHDNAFGQRLTAFMISKRLPDAAVPMSLLADHPNVRFNYYRHGIGSCRSEMH
jgi:glucosamine-6-phosphate deaminase